MRRLIAVPVVCALAWWGISSLRSPPGKSAPGAAATESVDSQPSGPSDRQPQSLPAAAQPVATVPAAALPPPAFAFETELSDYAKIKAKVLPDENEKGARRRLIGNADLLRGVGARLRQRPLLDFAEQAAAVDLLVDALRAGDQQAAAEALMSIVTDSQVEDASVPRPEREQLAGVKAEVLYHWLAFTPEGAPQVRAALPGPVSRRILDNVLQTHAANLAESRAEQARRQTR